MLQNLSGWHALVILAVVLLLFGAAKLPALAKSVGQSVRILKDEVGAPDEGRAAAKPVVAVDDAQRNGAVEDSRLEHAPS